jgi:hypothetical protein
MYFDDRERLQDFEGQNIFRRQNNRNPWIISLSNEKRSAVDKLLGYNFKSASKLTDEEVEEETLRWVVDTDIVVAENNKESASDGIESYILGTSVKYDSIKDLLVASSCHSTLESLAFLWNAIADALEDAMSSPSFSSSQSSKSAKLIVFSKAESLWNYDTIVTMLEAIQIAQPLLPTQFRLQLDLFHPDYKHSPRMWSPQYHSPFPTVGFTIKAKKPQSIDEFDIDMLRSKLDVLFQSGDAARKDDHSSSKDHGQVLYDCQNWVKEEYEREKSTEAEFSSSDADEMSIDWIVHSERSPFQLYRTVWNAALNLAVGHKCASIIIEPFLDSHTLYRVAVTVNAALKRLDIPVRVTNVFHPSTRLQTVNSEHETRPPYGMIQLSPTTPSSQ